MDNTTHILKTLNEFFEDSVKKFSDRPALSFAYEIPITYKEMLDKVITVADLLEKKGILYGDRVAILGENSPNWGISYFAILRAGAVAVPILPDFPEADIRHILSDSEAKILFTTQKQLQKVGDLGNSKLKHIITLDDFKTDDQALDVEPFSNIMDLAIDFIKKIPKHIGLKTKEITEDDLASIIYTSGTSGHSKAVMLTHKNLLSNAITMNKLIDINPDWTFLSVITLSHSLEFTTGFLFPLFNGARIVYLGASPTPSLLEKACKVEKPQAICAVPLILEKIYKKKVLPVLERNSFIKIITKVPGIKKKIYKKINNKLIEFFGGKLIVMAIGGALFNIKAETFFRNSGFPYLVGYGLTETSPLLAGGPFGDRTIKISSTGKPVPGVEIKIDNADKDTGIGDILARGPNVMKGYYKNPELTREVLSDDGWFKTGDLGYFDNFNNLHITGRSKNMILMSNGENIYPEAIEEKINSAIYVMESLVIENNNRLEAWVYPDYDLIDSDTRGKTEKQKREFIIQMLDRLKKDINSQLSSFSKISRVIEQKEPFVKTATLKIKRYLYSHR
ncbi:MAG: AMP-binding protein [Candidatus Aminicenantes bacterium]|nr:AMP-binding protein [Candidatus Aminicenantes bacterium]